MSDCRSRGREFDPAWPYTFMEIDHKIISMRGSRNFRQGGGPGQQVNLTKKSSDNVFFFFFFLVLSLLYRSQMVNFKENYHFSSFRRGSNIFHGGPTFSRGSNCLFPIETHITYDFPGGSGPPAPPPPLDPHLISTVILLPSTDSRS